MIILLLLVECFDTHLGLHIGLPPKETVIFNEKGRPITSATDVACTSHGIPCDVQTWRTALSQDFTHILFLLFLFFSAKHKASQVRQLMTFIPPLFVFVLKSRLIVQLSARSRVCGIATLEPLLQTTGVWSGVLDKSFSLCVQRITLFRKNWLQVLAVISHVFMT